MKKRRVMRKKKNLVQILNGIQLQWKKLKHILVLSSLWDW
jgi:hypothetical protein